ncbi:DoxX family protein [Gloeothece verrucosa]|uniref:DoxX family protein n=1 Tax=Gloeothece verrucosa (strain PCC 7822) TaxID=497965 RepID=E0ULW1_GLOV7|nr:DoxX family protein [Gloeothece verrucosa]ADN17941.1 DoxX family protein [Gloeothece verrucosa PCC 7822]
MIDVIAIINVADSPVYWFSSLNPVYPGGFLGVIFLILRASVGFLFMIHGYPKLIHLREWANSIKKPAWLCFISAFTMFFGGVALVLGFFTFLATLPIFCSMVFAIYLHIAQGKPFVARDPYLIPNDQYQGPQGKGEPPTWEKAYMYCVMLITIMFIGPGAFSLDALIFS